MAIEGPLRELGIHDVFQLLDLSRKTGVLRVTSDLRHNAGTIYFEDGTIIFAEIRSNPHPLGALLLRTGKITEADLERARDMQQRQGDSRRLGEILVSLGALTRRELQRQVRFQIEEVVFEVMSWRAGNVVLADPGTAKRERSSLAADLAELVAQAEDALARRDFEGARASAEQAAGGHPHDPAIHLLLGRVALAAGRGAEAVEELRRALRLDPLLVGAHRVLGYALVATGRFAEAVEQWDQWERLAGRSEAELAQREAVQSARTAAQTLAGSGTRIHG